MRLVTIREYAKRMGLSPSTVYRKIKAKEIEPVIVTKQVMRLKYQEGTDG